MATRTIYTCDVCGSERCNDEPIPIGWIKTIALHEHNPDIEVEFPDLVCSPACFAFGVTRYVEAVSEFEADKLKTSVEITKGQAYKVESNTAWKK